MSETCCGPGYSSPADALEELTHTNHDEPYSDEYIQTILKSVKTIAVVGASADQAKASYDVMRVLHEKGYDVIPVNPRPGLNEINGLKVYPSLADIDRPIDMVDVFRPSQDLPDIAKQAVAVGAKVFWAQLGLKNEEAAKIAQAGGMIVVMDRCPKIELRRNS